MTGAQPSGSLMTRGQLTLSQLIRLLFPARLLFSPLPLPLALISPFVSNPWAGRGRFVLPLSLSLLFSASLSLSVFLHLYTASLLPPSPFFHMLSDSSLDWTVFISSSSLH